MDIKRRDILIISGVLLLIGLRFALIINPLIEPNRGITVDSEQYLSLAESILDRQRYQSPLSPQIDLFRAPGYPIFLAGIFWLTGNSLMAVLLLQFILGILIAIVLYLFGKEIVDERVGLAGSVLFLLSPNALFWSATIMTEILFTAGFLLALFMMWKIIKEEIPPWPIGVLLGVLTLIRPIGLYLLLIFGVWLLLRSLLKIALVPTRRQIAGFFLAGFLVVTPWFIRNYLRHDKFTLSTVSSTTIRSFHLALTLVDAEGIEWEEAKLKVMELELDGSALLSIIQSYPGDFIKVQIRGIARTILGTEVGTWMKLISDEPYEGSGILNALLSGNLSTIKDAISNLTTTNHTSAISLLAWGIIYTLLIAAFSLIGFVRLIRYGEVDLKYLGILILITVLYLILSPGAAGEARFRIPVEPILAFFSALTFIAKPVSNPIEQE